MNTPYWPDLAPIGGFWPQELTQDFSAGEMPQPVPGEAWDPGPEAEAWWARELEEEGDPDWIPEPPAGLEIWDR